jgi:Exocyst complex component Sec3
VKHFPAYIGHVENQLIGADGLEIRTNVDAAYEKIVNTIFDSLKHMAKMNGEGEDKGQLNYHVILIGVCYLRGYILDLHHVKKTCTTLLQKHLK